MKGDYGQHVTMTCYIAAHAECNGRTYYGSIFGAPTPCECKCHGKGANRL